MGESILLHTAPYHLRHFVNRIQVFSSSTVFQTLQDFSRGLKEGWIPTIPDKHVASSDIYGSCYDIIFKTTDDNSFVHEFPSQKSLDTKNWQGFNVDE